VILFAVGIAVGILVSCIVARRAADKVIKQADIWRGDVIKLRKDRETLLQEVYMFKSQKDELAEKNEEHRKEIAELYDCCKNMTQGLFELLAQAKKVREQ
jgi:hypothetical protein